MRNNANAESTINAQRKEQLLKEFGVNDLNQKRVIKLIGEVQIFEVVQNGVHMLKDEKGNNILVKYQPGIIVIDNTYVYVQKQKRLYCFLGKNGKILQKNTRIRGNIKFTKNCVYFVSKANKVINVMNHGLTTR